MARRWRLGLVLLDQGQHPRAGIILEHHLELSGIPLQMVEHHVADIGDLLDQFPLGGIGQGLAEHLLE